MSEAAANMLVDLGRGEAPYGVGAATTQTLSQALPLSDAKEIKKGAAEVMVLNGQEREAQKTICTFIVRNPHALESLRPTWRRQYPMDSPRLNWKKTLSQPPTCHFLAPSACTLVISNARHSCPDVIVHFS
jgi:hypothetical protein